MSLVVSLAREDLPHYATRMCTTTSMRGEMTSPILLADLDITTMGVDTDGLV